MVLMIWQKKLKTLVSNVKSYKNTGKLMEKYNALDIETVAGGGEYPNQDGFGWTNGVYLNYNKIKLTIKNKAMKKIDLFIAGIATLYFNNAYAQETPQDSTKGFYRSGGNYGNSNPKKNRIQYGNFYF
jgi:hypothetical protein